jgi:hypothetical protein
MNNTLNTLVTIKTLALVLSLALLMVSLVSTFIYNKLNK